MFLDLIYKFFSHKRLCHNVGVPQIGEIGIVLIMKAVKGKLPPMRFFAFFAGKVKDIFGNF
jgi:hypothetical protein